MNQLQIALLQKGIIDLCGEVNGEMLDYVRESIAYLESEGSPDFLLKITSPGGSVIDGLDIYDMLRLYEGVITGRVVSIAASMGAVILQACDVRQCPQHSGIVIHHILTDGVSLDLVRRPRRIDEMRRCMEESQEPLYRIFEERMRVPKKEIRRICRQDQELSALEAKRLGLIDEVI